MGYTASSPYLKLHDRSASPLFMEWVARRYGSADLETRHAEGAGIYLDLGCAGGMNIQILAPLYPRLKFIGIDINPVHVAEAQAACEELGLGNVEFRCADFTEADTLPCASYINVHGVYSWLSEATRAQLDTCLGRAAGAGSLLKLHYSVLPGTQLRENLGHMLGALGADITPETARPLLALIAREAAGLKMLYSQGFFEGLVKRMSERSDEIWLHDYLNPDFKAEYSPRVMGRLEDAGFHFIASADIAQNIPAIQAKKGITDFARGLPVRARHGFMDQVTGRGYRNDVFARPTSAAVDSPLSSPIRLGNLWPREHMLAPFMTSQGEVDFRHDACRQIVDTLASTPLTLAELRQRLAPMPFETLMAWVDLLMAATRIEPFLPEMSASHIDRNVLRRLNRGRIAESMRNFNTQTSTSMLAAELGNCIDVGWFETLVLHYFAERHQETAQREMLGILAGAGISLAGTNGHLASDQAGALRNEVVRLEQGYFSRLGYWGVEI